MAAHMIEVLVDAEYQNLVQTDPLRRIAESALARDGVQMPCELAIVVCGDAAIRELNHRHLGVDAPTDVLAFPSPPHSPIAEASGQPPYLGDVVICFPQAKAQAADLGHSVEAELQLLVVHGVLHLLGYDDLRTEKRDRMWAVQEAIMSAAGVEISLPD